MRIRGISQLSPLKGQRDNDSSIVISIFSIQMLISKHHSPIKTNKPGLKGEKSDSISGAVKMQGESLHTVPMSKEVFKDKKEIFQKQMKICQIWFDWRGLPQNKFGEIWPFKIILMVMNYKTVIKKIMYEFIEKLKMFKKDGNCSLQKNASY